MTGMAPISFSFSDDDTTLFDDSIYSWLDESLLLKDVVGADDLCDGRSDGSCDGTLDGASLLGSVEFQFVGKDEIVPS
jgi:hypothetical protein